MSTNGARSHQNYKYIDGYVALSRCNFKGSAAAHELDHVLTDLPHLKKTPQSNHSTHIGFCIFHHLSNKEMKHNVKVFIKQS